MKECEDSIDRVMAGPERRTRVLSEHDKSVIAHHESGHALVGHVLAGTDPIHKVSIVSRGRALGWTLALPTEDRVLRTRSQLVDELAMLLGGRSAEEIVFGDITTGAQDDIERATRIARSMVTSWGMSEVLGPRAVGSADALPGADGAHGDQLASAVDDEVRRLIDAAHERAHRVINANRATLDLLAATLVERESLDEQELEDLFAGAADPGHPAPAPRPAPVEPPVAVTTEPVRAPVVAATRATRRAGWRGRVDAWRHGRDIPKGLA
jgi:cell division protease FtsH